MNCEKIVYSRCWNCHKIVVQLTCCHCNAVSSDEGFEHRSAALDREVKRYAEYKLNNEGRYV